MDRREELRKRLLNQQGKNDTQNTINTMKNLGLDLDRIRDVDRQAKLYDKPNHSIGQDTGLSEMVDDEGNYDINRENLQQSINDRERLLRERFESHNQCLVMSYPSPPAPLPQQEFFHNFYA